MPAAIALPQPASTAESVVRNPLRWFVFAVDVAADVMDLMDSTIVNVAGPSILATELLMISQEPQRWPVWLGAVVLAWFASGCILLLASNLRKVLGDRGLTAVERLMGMILAIVAVEMLMQGIAEYLRGIAAA